MNRDDVDAAKAALDSLDKVFVLTILALSLVMASSLLITGRFGIPSQTASTAISWLPRLERDWRNIALGFSSKTADNFVVSSFNAFFISFLLIISYFFSVASLLWRAAGRRLFDLSFLKKVPPPKKSSHKGAFAYILLMNALWVGHTFFWRIALTPGDGGFRDPFRVISSTFIFAMVIPLSVCVFNVAHASSLAGRSLEALRSPSGEDLDG